MPRESVDASRPEDLEPKRGRRQQSRARLVAALVVLGFAIAFFVQNNQLVGIRLWFVTVHVHLIWLLLVSVIFGAAAEFTIRRMIRTAGAVITIEAALETPAFELTMRAVTIVDGDLRWAEHPDPKPADGELLVAVRAAGLNAADLMQRVGLYPAPPGYPRDIPGMEFAGEVIELGRRTTRFAVGDRVMALVGGGAQAELVTVDEGCAMAVPPRVSWDEAGGFAEAFSTAYDALFSQCHVALGDRVLVTGAAGGVGTAAVELAAATGAFATASVRAPELRDAVAALGATEALDPAEALTRGPFDVALELVGGSSLPGVLNAMAIGGRIAVIGVGGGASAELDLLGLMHRRARIHGSTLRVRSVTEKAALASAVESHVGSLLASGRVRVPVVATFSMERATEAYERFAGGTKLGKIVLVTQSRRSSL